MNEIEKMLIENGKLIDKAIEKYIPRKYNKKNIIFTLEKPRYEYNIDSTNKAISEPIWNLLDRGGKRWRPTLLLLVCEALGGDVKKYFDLVVIPEIIHNGTLIVDDIEDGSELRRGKPCIHKIFGVDIAINAGNAMYFLPLLVLMRNNYPFKEKAYDIIIQEMINVSFGQAMDIAWHNSLADADNLSEKEYLQMCAYKTGCLARMAAKLGALAAGADEKTIEKMGALGESIGVLFQIQDDVLNLVGEQFQKGKGFGEDITEGKRTLIVINTLQKANKKDRERLLKILKMHTKDKRLIKEAISIMKKYGSIEYAKNFAKKMINDAWNEVDKILKESDAKKKLYALIRFAAEREV
jgi:geranylgeranyl diphosphate synthase type I